MRSVQANRQMFSNHFRPQIEFMGRPVKAFRYEQGLEKIIGVVNDDTGLQIELPEEKMLYTKDSGISIKWTSEAVRMVNEFYAKDFEVFGYETKTIDFISPE